MTLLKKGLKQLSSIFFNGATPGNDEENLRRILELSQIYFDRPEYNDLREEVGVSLV